MEIRCEWGLRGLEQHAAQCSVIVIVDVLSFSTSVDLALGCGALVLPYPWRDDGLADFAEKHKAQMPASDGPNLRPASLVAVPAGSRLVLPSPNGSELSFRANQLVRGSVGEDGVVIAGCLRNAAAVARYVNAHAGSGDVLVVPAGERWPDGSLRPGIEDWLGAGAIVAHLLDVASSARSSAEAEFAASAFRHAHIADAVRRSVSGREKVDRDQAEDIDLAVAVNASQVVARLVGGCFQDAG